MRVRGKCECQAGYYKGIEGPCIPIQCPPGFRWNSKTRECRSLCPGINELLVDGYCECVDGYSREDTRGMCMPNCKNGQIREDGLCSCPSGNKLIDGHCTGCPAYTQYVNGICLCFNG